MPACARISASGRDPFFAGTGTNIENSYFWQYLKGAFVLICSIIITQATHALIPPMVLPYIFLRAVHVGPPTCMRWSGDWNELGHSFFSPEPRKRNKVMILYYDSEGHVRRPMVCWLPRDSHNGGARGCRTKSFRFREGSLFHIVSALAPRACRETIYVPAMTDCSSHLVLCPCRLSLPRQPCYRLLIKHLPDSTEVTTYQNLEYQARLKMVLSKCYRSNLHIVLVCTVSNGPCCLFVYVLWS